MALWLSHTYRLQLFFIGFRVSEKDIVIIPMPLVADFKACNKSHLSNTDTRPAFRITFRGRL